jgi:hypothetical protein
MAVDYNEMERLREQNKVLQQEFLRREVADCLSAQEKLRKDQEAADAASAEASRVAQAEQLEKARRASWRNYNLNGAIKQGEAAFRRYLDRPMAEIDATDCSPQSGWPPGDGPHHYSPQALLPAPVEDDPGDVKNTLIGKALAAVGGKRH